MLKRSVKEFDMVSQLMAAGAVHSVPAQFVIGDDLPFQANYVTSGRTGDLVPGATLTYELLDQQSRAVKASGLMSSYDAPTASFQATIPKAQLQLIDPNTNPNGIVPNNKYVLHIIINESGIQTTISAELTASLDAIVA